MPVWVIDTKHNRKQGSNQNMDRISLKIRFESLKYGQKTLKYGSVLQWVAISADVLNVTYPWDT